MRRGRTSPSPSPEKAERGWQPPRFGGDFLVVLSYPGAYRTAMSSLGYQTILHGFSSVEGVTVQRLFLDEKKEKLHSPDGPLRLDKADLLAFSVAAENDYPGLLKILSLARLSIRAESRHDGDPPVLAGGIAPSLNPEPLALFLDGIVIGEGEGSLAGIVAALRRGAGKRDGLEALAGLEGLYVPFLYEPSYGPEGELSSFTPRRPAEKNVRRLWTADLDTNPAFSRIVAPESEFGELFLMEINRGCGRGCRFCAAGHLIRPLRHRSAARVIDTVAREAPPGLDRCGILGSAVADHPEIDEILTALTDEGKGLSVSSLRMDRATPELLALLKKGGCRSVAFAPETGSERLRKAVNKTVTDEQVVEAVGEAAAAGIEGIKLYFMIGLPGEEEDDREAIAAILKRAQERLVSRSRSRGRIGTISASIGCFVPKAWTPFQWHPFAGTAELKGALARVAGAARKIPNVTVSHDSARSAYVQAYLSRGDRRAGETLHEVHENGGSWPKAFRESAMDPDFFVSRQRRKDELFPWDFIDTGLRKERLWKEYRKALSTGREGGA